jgi:hypothetical protein
MVIMDDYDAGFAAGQASVMSWIDVEKQAPEMKKLVMYFHDMTGGPHLGYYFGRDESYPCENDHVFGGFSGFLTGDATHWMYVPDDPFEDEYLAERRKEWIEDAYSEIDKQIKEIKKEISI